MTLIKKGSSGEKVVDIQRRLKLLGYDLGQNEIDGIFGPETEKAIKQFQKDRAISVTGVVDAECWQELVDAGYSIGDRLLYLKEPPFRGDDVRVLQSWLKTLGFFRSKENGIFNRSTYKALIEFQKNMKLNTDGILGGDTLNCLKNLERIINEKKSSNFPFINEPNGNNKNKKLKIILDYGEFSADAKEESSNYLNDKLEICSSIVEFCKTQLEEAGFIVALSADKTKKNTLKLFNRIKKANKIKGDILISVNLGISENENDNDFNFYYFKGIKSHSRGGEKLSYIINNNFVENLGLKKSNIIGSNHAILKDTNMTAIYLELGSITNEDYRIILNLKSYQEKISYCITNAVIQFFKEVLV